MKEVILSAEAEMESVKTIPGVIDCEIDESTGFQLITVSLDYAYRDLPAALTKLHIEPRNFFIRVGGLDSNDYKQFITDSQMFQEVGLETVTAARWHTQHTKALVSESGKRLSFEDLLKPTGLAPSPQQIIASLSGMGDITRRAWLAKKPEYQEIWDRRSEY